MFEEEADEPRVRVDPWLRVRSNLRMNKTLALLFLVLFSARVGRNSFAQTTSTPETPTAEIVAAAKKFLAFLKSPEARKAIEAKGMKPPTQ